jgi:hypothetical protein
MNECSIRVVHNTCNQSESVRRMAVLSIAPYRPDSDSGAFKIDGCVFYDHARGEGGNVWDLAFKMTGGDRKKALESLHKSVGLPFVPNAEQERKLSQRQLVEDALQKVYTAFAIKTDKTPQHVIDYLNSRKVTEKTRQYFGFIPRGQLSSVLSQDEIMATGLVEREELIILWYFKGQKPVYYCTRDIATKAFKKAFIQNGLLHHPIWNGDDLYSHPNVVWGEGMFDCTSLMELGYGVCGEITCNLIEAHKDFLLTALRWRAKHHPDWKFTICLDNDAPTKEGKLPGNEASERMALWLWSNGVNVRWVKHDPAGNKVDINQLHQHGLDHQVRQMLDGAKLLSEIIPFNEDLCLKNIIKMMARCDYRGAMTVVQAIEANQPGVSVKDIIDKTHSFPWDWRDIYEDDLLEMHIHKGDVYAIFAKYRFGENKEHYQVFKRTDLVANLRGYQRNPSFTVKAR